MFSSFGAVSREEPSNKVHLLRSSHAYGEHANYTETQHTNHKYELCSACLFSLLINNTGNTTMRLFTLVKVPETDLRLGDVNNLVAQLEEDRVLG